MKSFTVKLLASVAIILPTMILSVTGCEPQKKALPSPAPGSRIVEVKPSPMRHPMITAEESNGLNSRLSNTVKDIRDVKKASVLVIGTTAYAGYEVNSGVDETRQDAVRSEMAAAIKRDEPRITAVWTTTNPTTAKKIDKVRADIKAKKPSSTYASDVRSILNECYFVRRY